MNNRLILFYAIVITFTLSNGQTLSGNHDFLNKKIYTFNANENSASQYLRTKRASQNFTTTNTTNVKVNQLNDKHKQLMVHWVGEGSSVIICLARDAAPLADPSAVYISYNYGDTYINKTDSFRLADGQNSTLEKFYNHQKFNTHFVFTDIKHKTIFITSDYGKNIKGIAVNFTPSDISFHEYYGNTFLVHDKEHPKQPLYLTEDFGNSFIKIQEFVKSFHWLSSSNGDVKLIVYRMEPSGFGTVFYSKTLFKTPHADIYSYKVKDLFIKGDYIFTTREDDKGNVDLYVSYKFGLQYKCLFDTQLDKKSYFIVDVTTNRAIVAVSHGKTVSHLYVSNNLSGINGLVQFTLSLEDVLCYFPNNTWHNILMQLMAEESFADVYKVEGLSGIYIASKVVHKPSGNNNIGPQNLGSVITFDHGATWRLIQAPLKDNEGQLISCDVQKNCSLHLSQKFSYLYPDSKTISILSSKSAPGILVATGIIGNSLKGHYGVYISTDAGWTWRQALKDLYFFNMGDHGGLLTAVKYYKSRGETRHILYSTDEGETWKQTPFNQDNLRLYGLMTEPGENTTVFTMFGSLPEIHQWIIIKLDLINAFQYNCSKNDYKLWSPSQSNGNRSYVPCIMGQQRTYQRRMPNSNCYNGLDYDTPISMKSCSCDILDYECDFGFVHTGKFGQCIRNKTVLLDPYKVPEHCPPGKFYNRTKGYRKISGDLCVDGFEKHYLPDQVPCPFNEIQDFILFAQRERISRFNLVTRTLEELPIKNLKNVIAIDFDMKNNCVYWADIALDIIGRQCLNNGSVPEILVSTDLASIEGMAFDWISNTLYFVDGTRSKIELIRTDIHHSGRMRKTILGPDVLKKPRGIALHPKHGYLFWTDWSAENPSVNRADLDGSHVKSLFKKPIVEWPNGISIDYIAERIYWVDAKQDYIASSDLQGDDIKYIIKDNEVVSHPFAVAVFKNSMFWDDWKRNSIFSADKDSYGGPPQSLEILQKQLVGLMDLKVFAHGIQIGNNTCSNDTCRYLCVASPSKLGYTCLCPDGMVQSNNDCLCPGNIKVTVNGTCPNQRGTCAPEHFMCEDKSCIPNGWKCDGEPDCDDGSDEVNCKTQSCSPFHFVCGDGKCIPHFWKCDYSKDCADGSDELNCPKSNCTRDQFTCNNGRCISSKWRCDGENDCKDNSDELNCSVPEPISCRSDEFHCKSGGTICIPSTWRCDKEKDCKDGSDEMECDKSHCSDDRFFCGAPLNTCIYKTWVCDGETDCPDGSDEKNCSQAIIPQRPKLPDLFNSQNGSCTEWMFKCRNAKCIPYWWKCDDADDCGDGSDELGCQNNQAPTRLIPTTSMQYSTSPSPARTCGTYQFQCTSGICILNSWVCDGMKDCPNAEDEANCNSTCDAKHFRCKKDGSCISQELVCNQKKDCPDGTDELYCDFPFPKIPDEPTCAIGLFQCGGAFCIPLMKVCDGHTDCSNGLDESNCTNFTKIYQVLQMEIDEIELNETSILFFWLLPMPRNIKLDFMPSISKLGEDKWQNMSFTNDLQFHFTNLTSFTIYNMTVYVRNKEKNLIYPPAKFYIASTQEGIPSPPWNITLKQIDTGLVQISWNKPSIPNGIISTYLISYYTTEPNSLDSFKLNGKDTSHILSRNFHHNMTYSFFIVAYNRRHKSEQSEVAKILIDKNINLSGLQNLKVVEVMDTSINLTWNYSGYKPEGFQIDVIISDHAYPKLEPKITKEHSIKIDGLSPGVMHQIKIYAFKKHFTGPMQIISQTTKGKALPEIKNIRGNIDPLDATIAKINWDKPHDSRSANWIYGVYYGVAAIELFDKAKLKTSNLSATIHNLGACETYTFTVGIIGPMGNGPLSHYWVELTTYSDHKAPPKRLTVAQDDNNPLRMRLQWEPSCVPMNESIGYIIKVYQQNLNYSKYFKLSNITGSPYIHHVFDVSYGGVYNVSVRTDVPMSQFTPYVTYYAPPILAPYEVQAHIEKNGSYFLYWQEREIPQLLGGYKYKVFVSPGNTLNESSSQKFLVEKPPFVYNNFTNDMFTFGVKLITHDNFSSSLSEVFSISNEYALSVTLTKSSISNALICILTLFIILSAVIAFLFVRHKRLQKSFTRFANSHYDTRSGAATFDDNHGLEDEIPRIQGFSDDEPLVIA